MTDPAERALVIVAHPDDVDFGSAGTVAAWVDEGTVVTYCLITSGDAGGFDPSVPRGDMPRIREAEQHAAAAAVGVSDVRFLGYPDGRLELSLDLRRDIARVIRQVRPQRAIVQNPERNWTRVSVSHPDHLAAGAAALAAIYPDARNPFTFPELAAQGLEPWAVSETWVQALEEATRWVDVTDTFDRKMAALSAHVSQTAHLDQLEQRLRDTLAANARRAGLPRGRLAEGYRFLDTR
ncbi:MAG: putative LmbE-like protein [Frankiales bacterium]|nr:putative LmbE-like protein [Frankiales bacterium]